MIEEVGTSVSATLKGKAMVAAIDAGMVPVASGAEGHNIAPFLRFWDAFSPALEQTIREAEKRGEKRGKFGGVFDEKRERRADYQQ